MARPQSRYVCQSCGAVAPRWAGRCEACGGWNSMVEEVVPGGPAKAAKPSGRKLDFVPLDGASTPLVRRLTGIAEFDRVTGGGLVPGSALLVGGDPGIGKSTLLLQAAALMAMPGRTGPAARVASASPTVRSSSPRRPRSATSWARSTPMTRPMSRSSIRSRRSMSTGWSRRRARSPRCAPRRAS